MRLDSHTIKDSQHFWDFVLQSQPSWWQCYHLELGCTRQQMLELRLAKSALTMLSLGTWMHQTANAFSTWQYASSMHHIIHAQHVDILLQSRQHDHNIMSVYAALGLVWLHGLKEFAHDQHKPLVWSCSATWRVWRWICHLLLLLHLFLTLALGCLSPNLHWACPKPKAHVACLAPMAVVGCSTVTVANCLIQNRMTLLHTHAAGGCNNSPNEGGWLHLRKWKGVLTGSQFQYNWKFLPIPIFHIHKGAWILVIHDGRIWPGLSMIPFLDLQHYFMVVLKPTF